MKKQVLRMTDSTTSWTYGIKGDPFLVDGMLYFIGDLVAYQFATDKDNIYVGVVCFNEREGHHCAMGSVGTNIQDLNCLTKVFPHNTMTKELYAKHAIELSIAKVMTKKEIENALGYSIDIIE